MALNTEIAEKDTPDQTPFKDLEKRTIFKNLSVFDTDYIPDEIFVRREFQPVVRFYFDCLKFVLQQALVIIGPTGSGKTLAARYYGREALQYAAKRGISLKIVYINSREIASPYVFWQEILRNFDLVTPKGLSISDLVQRFIEVSRGARHVVIILDEVEKLFTTLGHDKANNILYILSRLRSNHNLETAISMILVSNNAHLVDSLESPVRSSLNVQTLAIGSYSPDELTGILENRAGKGLKENTWNPGILRCVAAKTVQFNSDARFAIRLLKNAALGVESEGREMITQEAVNKAFIATKTEIERDLLARLGTSQLMVLAAISRAAQGQKDRLIKVGQVYKNIYRSFCESQGRKPLVYSQFLSIVSGLQNYDLVNNFVERRRTGGFIRLLEINFAPESLKITS